MRHFARLPHRITAVVGAALIGALGTVALAAPANGSTPYLKASVACPDAGGKSVVTWTLTSSFPGRTGTVHAMTAKLDGALVDGATLTDNGLTGTQIVDFKAVKETVLSVGVQFEHGVTDRLEATAGPRVGCEGPPVTVDFTNNCDGSVGVHIKNWFGAFRYSVVGANGFRADHDFDGVSTFDVVVPAADAGRIAIVSGSTQVAQHASPGAKVCGESTYTYTAEATCKLVIKISNPADGRPFTAVVTAGTQRKEVEVAVGKDYSVAVDHPTDGLVAKVTVDDKVVKEFTYVDSKCNPDLPRTGMNTPLIAGSALGLLAGGVILYYVARRRRIRFTA